MQKRMMSAVHVIGPTMNTRTSFATSSPVWDQLFATLASEDPYAHLSSIHNQYLNYDHSKPWVTHISAQGEVRYVLPPVNTNAHVGWYDVGHTKRHFPTRPIVWDEVMYEGKTTTPEGVAYYNFSVSCELASCRGRRLTKGEQSTS